jgi:hypothetical protein
MQLHSILPISGSQIKAWVAGHYNLNDFESDELETICDAAISHRAKWKKVRARKPRSRGKRHKRLRPYKVGPSSWCLTKMRKGQVRSLPVCPR